MLEKREERLNDLQTLLPAPRVEKFSYADKLAKDKDVMRQTILIWLSYWRDVMLRVAQARLRWSTLTATWKSNSSQAGWTYPLPAAWSVTWSPRWKRWIEM